MTRLLLDAGVRGGKTRGCHSLRLVPGPIYTSVLEQREEHEEGPEQEYADEYEHRLQVPIDDPSHYPDRAQSGPLDQQRPESCV
jgi:hypothetical protein